MATLEASILPKSQWKSPKSLEFSRVVKQKKKHQLWLLWSYIRLGCVGCVVYGLFHGVWWVSLYRTGDNLKSQWKSPKSPWFGAVPKRSPTADNRSSLLVLVNLRIRVCAVCLYNNNNNNRLLDLLFSPALWCDKRTWLIALYNLRRAKANPWLTT